MCSVLFAEHQKRLATLSIVLGSLYIGAAVIFLFGVGAAASVRHLFMALIPLLPEFPHHCTETLGPHPHILCPVCRGDRHHNCHWFSANDSSLYAQGKDMWCHQFDSTNCHQECPNQRMHWARYGPECGHHMGYLELGPWAQSHTN